MARPLRIEFPGAIYHVTSRGNAQANIYLSDADRHIFLSLLGNVAHRFNWAIYAYCLMSNHYHLVIETGDATLSKGMRQLNGVYTQSFNRQHKRVGHIFQGRYKAILVDKDDYLLEVIRYVLLNPVRAHITKSAGQYHWSSYLTMLGKSDNPEWLAKDRILSEFSNRISTAQQQFITFIKQGKNQPVLWEEVRNQIYLGDEYFVQKMQAKCKKDAKLDEVPRIQCRDTARPLEYYAKTYTMRKEAMREAYATGHYTFKEIADYFNVHYSTVSRGVNSK